METTSTRKKHKAFWPKNMVRRWLNGRREAEKYSSSLGHNLSNSNAREDMGEQEQRCRSFSERTDPIFMSGSISGGDVEEYWSETDVSGEFVPNQFVPSTSGPLRFPSEKFRLFVGTWNVGGRAPHDGLNLQDWLQTPALCDIYVLGFQEIVPLNAGNVLVTEDRGPAAKWLSLIRQALSNPPKRPAASGSERSAPVHPDRFGKLHVSFGELISVEDMMMEEAADVDLGGESTIANSSDDEAVSGGLDHRRRQGARRGAGFCLAASKQMVGLFLCVWVRNDLVRDIARVKASCVQRGIMGMGNKGSISISMTIRQSTFCFVCTHLASGENKRDEERRNYDVVEILKRTRFSRSRRRPIDPSLAPKTILQHGKIIWLGDLNYRLAMSCSDSKELLLKNDWTALLEKDQLRIEQKAGKIFSGWQEGKIYFPPTYKYLDNSDRYLVHNDQTKEKWRIPAWCDRILWRGEGIRQVCYVRGESRFSDHRPVYSIFSVTIDDAASADVGSGTMSPASTTTSARNSTNTPIVAATVVASSNTSATSDKTTARRSSSKKKKGYNLKWPVWAGTSDAGAAPTGPALRCSSSLSERLHGWPERDETTRRIGRTQSCRLTRRC